MGDSTYIGALQNERLEAVDRVAGMPLEVVEHVLWFLGDMNYGLQPGHFISSLLRTIERADPVNRLKLTLVFQDYVDALTTAQRVSIEVLRDRVKAAIA